jgi:hypothetical protein
MLHPCADGDQTASPAPVSPDKEILPLPLVGLNAMNAGFEGGSGFYKLLWFCLIQYVS